MTENSAIDVLHEIGSSLAAADPLHAVLSRVVEFVSTVVQCDSCFVYVLEDEDLVCAPRRRRTPTSSIGLSCAWAGHHRVGGRTSPAGGRGSPRVGGPALPDVRRVPEDRYDAFLSVPVLSRGKLVGVINVQHREPHKHSRPDIQLISTFGFLVGAEIRWRASRCRTRALRAARDPQGGRPRQGHPAARPRADRGRGHLTIQRQSRQRRKSKKEIAEAIVLGDELRKMKG